MKITENVGDMLQDGDMEYRNRGTGGHKLGMLIINLANLTL